MNGYYKTINKHKSISVSENVEKLEHCWGEFKMVQLYRRVCAIIFNMSVWLIQESNVS